MRTLSLVTAGFIAATAAAACSGDTAGEGEHDVVGSSKDAINEYLVKLPKLDIADIMPKTEISCEGLCPENGENEDGYFCTYQRYTETVQYDRFVAFQPNSATLWPGSVIHGEDAQYGHLNPLSVELSPSTFSFSLENIRESPVGQMHDPSLSSFREERNRILGEGVTGATPAAIDFEVFEVHSESQVAVALGAGADWPGAGAVTGNFDFSTQQQSTKVLVNFTQAYYTVDVDAPTSPADFFDASVTVDQLKGETSPENPPLYIQSITFGRRVLFSIESTEDATTITSALEAAMTKAVSAEANVDVTHQEVLSKSKIRAFVVGGAGGEATGVVNGFAGLVKYIQSGGDYSKDSPGAPIAYKLAYLNNASAQLSFTTEYNERQCERTHADVRIELLGIDHLGGNDVGSHIELYGNVNARLPVGEEEVNACDSGGKLVNLWELLDGSWVEFEEYGSWEPTSPVYIYQEEVRVSEGERLCLTSDLWDEDGSTNEFSGDDDMGYGELEMLAQEGWEGFHTIQVRGDGEAALDVHVSIEVQ